MNRISESVIRAVSYGQFGGPFWTNGRIASGDEAPTAEYPGIDALDVLFRRHDQAYAVARQSPDAVDLRRASDIILLRDLAFGLAGARIPVRGRIYRVLALAGMSLKITVDGLLLALDGGTVNRQPGRNDGTAALARLPASIGNAGPFGGLGAY